MEYLYRKSIYLFLAIAKTVFLFCCENFMPVDKKIILVERYRFLPWICYEEQNVNNEFLVFC